MPFSSSKCHNTQTYVQWFIDPLGFRMPQLPAIGGVVKAVGTPTTHLESTGRIVFFVGVAQQPAARTQFGPKYHTDFLVLATHKRVLRRCSDRSDRKRLNTCNSFVL